MSEETPTYAARHTEPAGETESSTVIQIPVELIEPSPHQPRTTFDADALTELAESIEAHGVLEPLLVRRGGTGGRFQLVAGERRLRAARLAGLGAVPCLVRHLSDQEAAEATTIENLQRADLNPIEEAQAYQTLLQVGQYTQEELGRRIGKGQSAIAKRLALLQLPDPVQALLVQGRLSAAHGVALGRYRAFPDACQVIAEECVAKQVPSKQLERELVGQATLAKRELCATLFDYIGGTERVDWTTACAGCEAFVKLGESYPFFCLRPACAKEKAQAFLREQEERKAARSEEVSARLAQATAAGERPVLTSEEYGATRARPLSEDMDCPADCPDRVRWLPAGGIERPACMNEGCYDQKLAARRAAHDAMLARRQADRLDRALAILDAVESDPACAQRALAFLALRILQQGGDGYWNGAGLVPFLRAAAERQQVATLTLPEEASEVTLEIADQLTALDPLALVRLMAEARVRYLLDSFRGPDPALRWFIDERDPDDPAPAPDDDDRDGLPGDEEEEPAPESEPERVQIDLGLDVRTLDLTVLLFRTGGRYVWAVEMRSKGEPIGHTRDWPATGELFDDRETAITAAITETRAYVQRIRERGASGSGTDTILAALDRYLAAGALPPLDDDQLVCEVCGCTEDAACPGGCWWVRDNLCSACAVECPDCAGAGEREEEGTLVPCVTCGTCGHVPDPARQGGAQAGEEAPCAICGLIDCECPLEKG